MDKPISPATRERIRKLCGHITVAHDLDPEIQEELSGHLEDKLHGYLAGEEILSEEDAYMLTRRHFGDVSALKVLLQDVHDRSVYTGLARRLTAALVATVFLSILKSLVLKGTMVALALWAVQTNAHYDTVDSAGFYIRIAMSLVSVGLLWYWLSRWQRQLAQGGRPWFVRWSALRMWAVAGAVLIAPQLMPGMTSSLPDKTQPLSNHIIVIALLVTSDAAPVLLSAFAWLWWSDRRPRVAQGLLGATLSWASLQLYFSISPTLVPMVVIGLDPAVYLGKPIATIAQGSFLDTSLRWSLAWREALLANQDTLQEMILPKVVANAVAMTIAALVALTLYETLRFASARIARRSVRRQACA